MRKLILVLLLSTAAFGQGIRIGDQSPTVEQQTIGGYPGILQVAPNAKINFCSSPANGVPCTNYATTYTDSTLSTPCSVLTQVTLYPTNTCTANSDSNGNWGVWVPAGLYAYTVTVGGQSFGPYPALATVPASGSGLFSNLNLVNPGSFTTQEQDYFASSINNCNPQTEIQAGQGNTFWNVSAITGCVTQPLSGTNTQITGIAGLATGQGTWQTTVHGAIVGVYGQGRCLADNCGGWGGNLIYEDDGSRTTGVSGHGLEIDVGQQSPSTAYSSLFGIASSLGGNGTGLVANSYAYEAGVQPTPHNLQWNWAFYSQQGASASGIFLGPIATSGTVISQPITFQGFTSSVGKNVTIGGSSGGDFVINPVTTGRFMFLNGNMEFNGVSTLTGTGGGAVLASDSTASNVLKLSNNGDTFSPVSRTIASGTASMTTGAITTLTCGATVTVAATGVATTDSITWSFNAAPPANPGALIISAWPTANNVNFQYCNPQAGSVTPSAATLNWRVVR